MGAVVLSSCARSESAGPLSLAADRIWQYRARNELANLERERATVQKRLEHFRSRLSIPQPSAPEIASEETTLNPIYGHPPEVYVDAAPAAHFPRPLTPPLEFSWHKLRRLLREIRGSLDLISVGMDWLDRRLGPEGRNIPAEDAQRIYYLLEERWFRLGERYSLAAKSARYLETWIPVLVARQEAARTRGLEQELSRAVMAFAGTSSMNSEEARRFLRPRRSLAKKYLGEPGSRPPAKVVLPVRTDLNPERDRSFLREIEAAVDSYWNEGPWRRRNRNGQPPKISIRWSFRPPNPKVADGSVSLSEHIASFGEDQAALTTGALSTHVQGHVLILGPGRVQPRTLAHEVGHLLGFVDCYLRTMVGQGLRGVRVLEWDNPAYPDELMCDNMLGTVNQAQW